MLQIQLQYVVLAVVLCTVLYLASRRANALRLPLPPGPRGLPVIGNLLDVPTTNQWLVFDEWAKKYGDLMHVDVMGQPMIILNSLKTVTDILEKRSAIYSSRPRMPMLIELMDWTIAFAFTPYGADWRLRRKMFHTHYNSGVVKKYQPIQEKATSRFLMKLLESPKGFASHIRGAFAFTIMDIAYGIKVEDNDDWFVSNAKLSLGGMADAGVNGTYLVDFIPLLKWYPEWMPGGGFQKKAKIWKQANHDLTNKPWEIVQENIAKGEAVPCVATSLISNLPDDDERRPAEEQAAKDATVNGYVGGSDTTVSYVHTFFLAMAMYPEVQKKAQAEIDSVTGGARLPCFDDRDSLPYVNAIIKEVLRWQVVAPLAATHASTEEDVYEGYRIPKDSIVIGNAWAILHDPIEFPEPEEFRPERFIKDGKLDPNRLDPNIAAFGFGRRICPGRFLGDTSLYIYISSTLAVFDVTSPLDENGQTVQLKPEMTSGLLSYPVPFDCDIKPRSAAAESLIRDSQFL
ncbi:cytochrome P450 [Infundibulicybe gibba]|nr:cytochrome P450 [Infundibulicybe gibba]